MDKSVSVAKYLYEEYNKRFQNDMDEMRMHKLMYFLQRESLIEKDVFLFNEHFHGWKFGPVLKSVRSEYIEAKKNGQRPFSRVHDEVSDNAKALVDNILATYGDMSSWKLSALSHCEFSWVLSRKGLNPGENGDVEMKDEAIRFDSLRERIRRRKQHG